VEREKLFTQRAINWRRKLLSFLLTNNQCGKSNDSYPVLPYPFFARTSRCTQMAHTDSSRICPSSCATLFIFHSTVEYCLSKRCDFILVSINLKGLECTVHCAHFPILKANLNLTKCLSGDFVVW